MTADSLANIAGIIFIIAAALSLFAACQIGDKCLCCCGNSSGCCAPRTSKTLSAAASLILGAAGTGIAAVYIKPIAEAFSVQNTYLVQAVGGSASSWQPGGLTAGLGLIASLFVVWSRKRDHDNASRRAPLASPAFAANSSGPVSSRSDEAPTAVTGAGKAPVDGSMVIIQMPPPPPPGFASGYPAGYPPPGYALGYPYGQPAAGYGQSPGGAAYGYGQPQLMHAVYNPAVAVPSK